MPSSRCPWRKALAPLLIGPCISLACRFTVGTKTNLPFGRGVVLGVVARGPPHGSGRERRRREQLCCGGACAGTRPHAGRRRLLSSLGGDVWSAVFAMCLTVYWVSASA